MEILLATKTTLNHSVSASSLTAEPSCSVLSLSFKSIEKRIGSCCLNLSGFCLQNSTQVFFSASLLSQFFVNHFYNRKSSVFINKSASSL